MGRTSLFFIAVFSLVLVIDSAQAELGRTNKKNQNSQEQCFSVEISQAPNGVNIREYSKNGLVFAVTWDGPRNPDLKSILGDFHGEVTKEIVAKKESHKKNFSAVESANVIFSHRGHQRHFNGAAILKGQIPSCMNPGELK